MGEMGLDDLPEAYHEAFAELTDRLQRLLGRNLIGFTAYGGWLHEDPFLKGELATSVVVLRKDELDSLTNIASKGYSYAARGVRAPYFMSEEYLRDSLDSFPIEFLEIQQTGKLLHGEDRFGALKIRPDCVRVQCERMLKSELMYLRQGLLRPDAFSTMRAIFRACAIRLLRVLSAVLFLHGTACRCHDALVIVPRCMELTSVDFSGLQKFIEKPPDRLPIGNYKLLYREVRALAAYVDAFECRSDE